MKIIPVILSGGMGTRLWPMSRGNYPKQFLKLSSGELSLIQETLIRVKDPGKFEPPVVVCNQDHRFLVAEKLRDIDIKDAAIILEPSPRNTAPALALAAYYIKEAYDNAIMLVLPSDHIIRDPESFLKGVDAAIEIAKSGYLVTFGIKPEYAETGYGYIKRGKALDKSGQAYEVEAFVEKPNEKLAKQYAESEEYVWNSGMFVFPVDLYLSELSRQEPEMVEICAASYGSKIKDKDFIWVDEKIFINAPKESIDYAVMEGTEKAAVIPLQCGWSDAGSWDALWRISKRDGNNNYIKGECHNIDTKNSYISAEKGLPIATIGVDNLVVITTKDCVLVADKSRAQDLKKLVSQVKEKRVSLVENHRQVYRPWGFYDSIDNGQRYQVKHITVKPGAKISLQMHYHRAEHWVVVSGTARIIADDKEHVLTENQSIYIPCGTVHRIENPGKINLEIIEIQSGSYLGEDDIVRFDDTYGRK